MCSLESLPGTQHLSCALLVVLSSSGTRDLTTIASILFPSSHNGRYHNSSIIIVDDLRLRCQYLQDPFLLKVVQKYVSHEKIHLRVSLFHWFSYAVV